MSHNPFKAYINYQIDMPDLETDIDKLIRAMDGLAVSFVDMSDSMEDVSKAVYLLGNTLSDAMVEFNPPIKDKINEIPLFFDAPTILARIPYAVLTAVLLLLVILIGG